MGLALIPLLSALLNPAASILYSEVDKSYSKVSLGPDGRTTFAEFYVDLPAQSYYKMSFQVRPNDVAYSGVPVVTNWSPNAVGVGGAEPIKLLQPAYPEAQKHHQQQQLPQQPQPLPEQQQPIQVWTARRPRYRQQLQQLPQPQVVDLTPAEAGLHESASPSPLPIREQFRSSESGGSINVIPEPADQDKKIAAGGSKETVNTVAVAGAASQEASDGHVVQVQELASSELLDSLSFDFEPTKLPAVDRRTSSTDTDSGDVVASLSDQVFNSPIDTSGFPIISIPQPFSTPQPASNIHSASANLFTASKAAAASDVQPAPSLQQGQLITVSDPDVISSEVLLESSPSTPSSLVLSSSFQPLLLIPTTPQTTASPDTAGRAVSEEDSNPSSAKPLSLRYRILNDEQKQSKYQTAAPISESYQAVATTIPSTTYNNNQQQYTPINSSRKYSFRIVEPDQPATQPVRVSEASEDQLTADDVITAVQFNEIPSGEKEESANRDNLRRRRRPFSRLKRKPTVEKWQEDLRWIFG